MSDNMTPEEYQEALTANKRALDAGTISQEQYNKRLEELQKTTKTLTDKFDSAVLGLSSFAGKLKEGSEKTSAYNDAIGKGGDVLTKFASGVSPVLGTLVKGITMYAQAVNKQADQLYSSYKDISRLGATGAAGLSGVYDGMKKLGYGVDQLGEMQGLLSDSATTLASLSGTVADGTAAVASVSKNIRDSDIGNKFLTMGISVDNMNKGIVSYLKIQTQVGQAQMMTQQQLRDGAARYVEEADKLTKMTGMTLQAQQAADQAALAEDRFGAWADQQRKMGNEASVDTMLTVNKMLQNQGAGGQEIAQGLKDIKSGAISTDAAQKLMMSIPNIVNVVQKQGVTADEIQKTLLEGSGNLKESMGQTRAIVGSAGFISQASMQAIGQAFGTGGAGTVSGRAAAAAVGQEVTDKPTKSLTDFATSARSARDNMQDMIQRGIEPVTTSMAGLAKVTDKISGVPNKLLGSSMGGSYTGAGAGGFLGGKPGEPTGPITAQKVNASANFKQQAPQVMEKLMKDFNLSKEQAAGIVGNLGHESAGLQAGIQEKNPMGGGRGGLGWAQWTGPRRKAFESYLQQTGQSASDPNANYGFLKQELQTNYAGSLAAVKKTDNAQDATIAFEKSYERAGVKHYGSRIGYANEALALTSGPTSGRQGVQLADAASTVGTKGSSPNNGASQAQAMDKQQQDFMARQASLQEEANDLARRQLVQQQKTNAKLS